MAITIVVPLLSRCARCGLNHADIEFTQLKRPVADTNGAYHWWAPCPYNGEPILMRQANDREVANATTKEDPNYIPPTAYHAVETDDYPEADQNGAKSG